MRYEDLLALRNNQYQARRKTHAAWMFVQGSVSGQSEKERSLPRRQSRQAVINHGDAVALPQVQLEVMCLATPDVTQTEERPPSLVDEPKPKPIEFYPVPAPFNICEIACGPRHVLLRTSRGLVYSFGHGEGGRLGLGDEASRVTPVLLDAISQRQCISVACGRDHSIVVFSDGKAFAFGWGEGGRLGVGEEADSVLAPRQYCAAGCGREHTLLLSADGDVYFCGMEHPLEDFSPSTSSLLVQHAILTPTLVPLPEDELVVAVAGGDAHSALLTHAGHVFTWGFGGSGALGHGNDKSLRTPHIVHKLKSYHVVQLTCGHWHTSCLTSVHDFWAWGDFGEDNNRSEVSSSSLRVEEASVAANQNQRRSCVPLNFVVSRPQQPPPSDTVKQPLGRGKERGRTRSNNCFQRISVGCGKSFVIGETEELFEIDSVSTNVGILKQAKEHSQCMQHAQLFTTSDLLVGSGDFYSVLCVQNV